MAVTYAFTPPINPLTPALTDQVPAVLANQLGSGLQVPMAVANNQWSTVYGTAYVQQCILIAIMTPVGNRFVFPSFGTIIPRSIFENYNPTLRTQMVQSITNALALWVPQISNVSVQIDETQINNETLMINVFYQLKGTNAQQTVTLTLSNNPSINLPPSDFQINNYKIFRT